jgi:hypothetical protein
MPRGQPLVRGDCPARACANCDTLRFLKYAQMTPVGRTGHHFCRTEYRETGVFDEQPWDFTCDGFVPRKRTHQKNKTVLPGTVPVVHAPKDYEPAVAVC